MSTTNLCFCGEISIYLNTSYFELCLHILALTLASLGFQSELFSKLKSRQSDSDMDDGLPSSPLSTLTTADVILGGGLKVYNFCLTL